MADLGHYLKAVLKTDYEGEIERKTLQLLSKWDILINSAKNQPDSGEFISRRLFSEISQYFLKNKRCKIPWTIAEVEHAVGRFQDLIVKLVSIENSEVLLENSEFL